MKCSICGYKLENGASFCPNCGEFVKKDKKNFKLIIYIVIALAISSGVILLFLK